MQETLFHRSDTPQSQMQAINALNTRFGRDTITYAAPGRRRGWRLRSSFLSPRYTTSWQELLAV